MSDKKKSGILLIGIVIILAAILLVIVMFGKEKEKKVVVGMVLTGSIDEVGWNGHHYEGLKSACEENKAELIVKQNISENKEECAQAVNELIDEGAKLIILSSFNYNDNISDLIKQRTDISFYCCSSGTYTGNASDYFVRVYQARYLAGIVAGMQTKNNKIGYVAAMPNSEVYRGINAFTLGVLSVNPDARVYLDWTGVWNDEELERAAAKKLIDEAGVDLITYHQNQGYVIDEAEKAGILSIGYHEYMEGYSDNYLTATVEAWDSVYREILREYMQGKGNSSQLIWLGLENNAVGLAPFSEVVDEETKEKVSAVSKKMENGWEVFSDLIVTNDGVIKCQEGEVISDDIIFEKMDWLVEGVISYED